MYGHLHLLHGRELINESVDLVLNIICPGLDFSEENRLMKLVEAWIHFEENRLVELVDPTLHLHGDERLEAQQTINITLLCIQRDPEKRPTMVPVVAMCKGTWHQRKCCPSQTGSLSCL